MQQNAGSFIRIPAMYFAGTGTSSLMYLYRIKSGGFIASFFYSLHRGIYVVSFVRYKINTVSILLVRPTHISEEIIVTSIVYPDRVVVKDNQPGGNGTQVHFVVCNHDDRSVKVIYCLNQ